MPSQEWYGRHENDETSLCGKNNSLGIDYSLFKTGLVGVRREQEFERVGEPHIDANVGLSRSSLLEAATFALARVDAP